MEMDEHGGELASPLTQLGDHVYGYLDDFPLLRHNDPFDEQRQMSLLTPYQC